MVVAEQMVGKMLVPVVMVVVIADMVMEVMIVASAGVWVGVLIRIT